MITSCYGNYNEFQFLIYIDTTGNIQDNIGVIYIEMPSFQNIYSIYSI